jgi:hypothetical protein
MACGATARTAAAPNTPRPKSRLDSFITVLSKFIEFDKNIT